MNLIVDLAAKRTSLSMVRCLLATRVRAIQTAGILEVGAAARVPTRSTYPRPLAPLPSEAPARDKGGGQPVHDEKGGERNAMMLTQEDQPMPVPGAASSRSSVARRV